MRIRSALGFLGCAAVLSPAVAAQEPSPVFRVVTLEHTPETMVAWRNAEAQLAAAVKAAGLPAAEVGWWAYVKDNTTTLVMPASRDALFPGPGAMARLRQRDSAKAAEIARAFEGTRTRVIRNEIVQHAPNLSYTPATEPTEGGVFVYDVTIAPGQGQAFNRAIEAQNQVRTALGYPYPMALYRVRIGEPRTTVVFFFDTAESFFGKNGMERLLEGKPALQHQWQESLNAVLASSSGWNSWMAGYAANLSYPPM